jgi:hypothetical protein
VALHVLATIHPCCFAVGTVSVNIWATSSLRLTLLGGLITIKTDDKLMRAIASLQKL